MTPATRAAQDTLFSAVLDYAAENDALRQLEIESVEDAIKYGAAYDAMVRARDLLTRGGEGLPQREARGGATVNRDREAQPVGSAMTDPAPIPRDVWALRSTGTRYEVVSVQSVGSPSVECRRLVKLECDCTAEGQPPHDEECSTQLNKPERWATEQFMAEHSLRFRPPKRRR